MSTEMESEARGVICNRLGDCLVFQVPEDLGSGTFEGIRQGFSRAQSTGPIRGVILDCSGIEVMDLDDYEEIQKVRKIFGLLGAKTILLGLKPGVVAALVGLGCEGESLMGALGLEQAIALIKGSEAFGRDKTSVRKV